MKEEKEEFYESFPSQIIFLSAIVTFLSYALGALIFYLVDIYWAGFYTLFALSSLFIGLRYRCRFCYYFGKRCPTGFGVLAGLIFKKGDNKEFENPRNLVPAAIFDFTVLLLPIILAVTLMIIKFSYLTLILLAFYIVGAVLPGFFLKKLLLCKHCMQRKLGCPACEKIGKCS